MGRSKVWNPSSIGDIPILAQIPREMPESSLARIDEMDAWQCFLVLGLAVEEGVVSCWADVCCEAVGDCGTAFRGLSEVGRFGGGEDIYHFIMLGLVKQVLSQYWRAWCGIHDVT